MILLPIKKKNLLKLESCFETVCRYLLTEDVSKKEVNNAIKESTEPLVEIIMALADTFEVIDQSEVLATIFEQGNLKKVFTECFRSQMVYNIRRTIQKLPYLLHVTLDYYDKVNIAPMAYSGNIDSTIDNKDSFPLIFPSLPNMFFLIFMSEVIRDNINFRANVFSFFDDAVAKLKIPKEAQSYISVYFVYGTIGLIKSIVPYEE